MAELSTNSCGTWSSRDFSPAERFDAWQEALNGTHLHWGLERRDPAGFAAEVSTNTLRDLQVIGCQCQPCSGFRGHREIAASTDAYYGLLLMLEGREEVRVDGKAAMLESGKILLWDSTVPVQFKIYSPVRKVTVMVPQERMHEALPIVRNLVGLGIDWKQGMGAVAVAHITALCAQAAHINQAQSRSVAENTLELVATTLEGMTCSASELEGAELLSRIKQHIEHNLSEADLKPKTLAGRFGISVRYLHLLFGRDGQTVSRWIQQRRLEKCRRELALHGSRKSITEVALAWGFNDTSHFSRVFKKRYGMSPRLYRRSTTN